MFTYQFMISSTIKHIKMLQITVRGRPGKKSIVYFCIKASLLVFDSSHRMNSSVEFKPHVLSPFQRSCTYTVRRTRESTQPKYQNSVSVYTQHFSPNIRFPRMPVIIGIGFGQINLRVPLLDEKIRKIKLQWVENA